MQNNKKTKNSDNEIIMAVSNQYIMKYYSDEILNELTDELKDNIKLILVKFTEECGGIVELVYNVDFNDLTLKSYKEDVDYTYDEIEANFKLAKIEKEYEEFFDLLSNYIKGKLVEKLSKNVDDNKMKSDSEHNHGCDCGHDNHISSEHHHK